MNDTGIFGEAKQETQGNIPSDPAYIGYAHGIGAEADKAKDKPRPKAPPPHMFSHLDLGDQTTHKVAYYIEYGVVFMVYGFIAAAIALVVYEGVWDLFGSTAAFAAAGFVCGLYIAAIGFVIHPWMRKHLPEKD